MVGATEAPRWAALRPPSDVEPGSPMTTTDASTGDRTVVDVIVEDHRVIQDLFRRGQATTDPQELKHITDQVIGELVRHAEAEEQYLYPAFREHLEGGDELADHELSEHQEAEAEMDEIMELGADDPELRRRFEQLVEEINHHIEGEETEALPRLAAACPREQLVTLGTKIEAAKKMAPTRPHPSSPDTPPLNKVLGLGASLVDRTRDAVTGRDTHAPERGGDDTAR